MLNVQIITPEKALPDLEVDHLTASAADGEVGIRPGHAPLVAALVPGVAMVRCGGQETWWAVGGGVMQVLKDQVRLLVEQAGEAAAIDADKVRARIAALESSNPRDPELAWARAQLAAAQRAAAAGAGHRR